MYGKFNIVWIKLPLFVEITGIKAVFMILYIKTKDK